MSRTRSSRYKEFALNGQLALYGLRLQFSVYFYHLFGNRCMFSRFQGDADRPE